MVKLNRFGSIWDRNERIRQNDDKEIIEKSINNMNEVSSKADETLNEAINVNNRNINTDARLDNIIADSGTSSTEVVDARGEHTVLDGRLNEIDSQLAEIEKDLEGRSVNVDAFGAIGDGVTDDTQAFLDAIESLDGKGIIELPGKTYVAQGLPLKTGIYYKGRGIYSTVLTLPEQPSNHLFLADSTDTTINGAGISDMDLYGVDGGTADYNALDFSALKNLQQFNLTSCRIQRFNKAYSGSDNDRWAFIFNNKIYNNIIGVRTGEHAILIGNDLRFNDVGLTGRINDLTSLYNKFNYNRVGAEPSEGQYINNSIFQNTSFWGNTEKGIEINRGNIISGGKITGVNDDDIGILISGRGNKISLNAIGQTFNTGFENGAIVFSEDATTHENDIINNIFDLAAGPGIVHNGDRTMYNIDISHNQVSTSGHNMFPFIKTGEGVFFGHSKINGNNIYTDKELFGSIFDIPNSFYGYIFSGNNIYIHSQGKIDYVISGDVRNSHLINNRFAISGESLGVLNATDISDDTLIKDNYGLDFKVENSGSAIIPISDTSVDVEHGLDITPQLEKFIVTPRSELGDATMFWINDATDTTFTIYRNGSGGRSATFNWRY